MVSSTSSSGTSTAGRPRSSQTAPCGAEGHQPRSRSRPGVAQQLRLVLVGDQGVGHLDHRGRQVGVRRDVEHDADLARRPLGAQAAATVSRGISSWTRSTSSGDMRVDDRQRGVRHAAVGARHHDDRVLGALADDDQGRAGRLVVEHVDGGGVDAGVLQPLEVSASRVVVADRPDHGDVCSGRSSRHGLVGPLAAGEPVQALAEDGLAGLGMPLDAGDEVEVERPEHDHAAGHRGRVRSCGPGQRVQPQPGVAVAVDRERHVDRGGAWPCGSWARLPSQSRRSTIVRPRDQVPASSTRTGSRWVVRCSGSRTAHTAPASPSVAESSPNRSHWKAISRPASPAGPVLVHGGQLLGLLDG